jgi:hypothetical protein
MEIFKLFGSIFVDNDKANKSIDDTDKKAGGVGATLGKMGSFAVKAGAAIGTAAVAGGAAMFALANKTADAADVIDKLSERTGINREELQRWQYAAGQSGADVEKLEVGIKKLSDQMDGAVQGNEKAAEAFGKIGISMDDLKNKSQEEIFSTVMAELADMEQGAARNALGNDLLGKSYTEMLPLLNAGSQGMADLKNNADKLGIVMSEEAVIANVKFGDSLSDVKQAFGGIFMRISNDFLPVLNQSLDWVLAHMPEIQAGIETAFDVAGKAVDYFTDAIKWARENANWLIPVVSGLAFAIGTLVIIDTVNKLMVAWKASTIAQTLAQGGLNAVMAANPIALVVLGIAALVAAGVALYMHWDTVKAKAQELGTKFKDVFGGMKTFVIGIWDGIGDGIKGSINVILKYINKLINGLNQIDFSIPDWVPLLGGKSWGFNIDKIPLLADGGNVIKSGKVIVGENGPEELNLPTGARVTPLSKVAEKDSQKIENNFNIEKMEVRNDNDIKLIARELYNLQKSTSRGRGLVST